MSAQDNKAVIQRLYQEALNGKNLDVLDELLAPDFSNKRPGKAQGSGREASIETHERLFEGIPDFWIRADDWIVCEDKVVVSFSMGGTHTGNYFGLRPTGKTVDGLTGIEVFGIADGKIAEHWGNWDRWSFYQQLGLIPSRQELRERQGQ
jgi:steroid delta-isomerase-like uncharacterized protein